MKGSSVSVKNVSKSFGSFTALQEVSFNINKGCSRQLMFRLEHLEPLSQTTISLIFPIQSSKKILARNSKCIMKYDKRSVLENNFSSQIISDLYIGLC